jgi:hypothetical protein
MTDKLFDDFFKEKLEHHDSGAPMHVWEKVRRELHEDDDDKVIVWWRNPLWLIALFLLAGGIATTGIVGNKKGWFNNSATAETIAQNKNVNSNTTNTENNNTQTTNAATDDNAVKTNAASIAADDIKQTNSTVTDNNITDAVNINTTSTKTVLAVDKKSNAVFNKNRKSKRAISKLLANTATILDNQVIAAVDGAGNNKQNDLINSYYLPLAYGEAANKNFKSILEIQKNNLGRNGFSITSSCPTIGPPRRNDLYVEVYGSADNVSRSLSGTNFTPVNYIDKRKEAEKSKVGFSAGIRLSKNLGERTLLKTGVNFSQINETLKYINEKDIRIITIITQRTIFSNGQTIVINDTTQVTQIGTTYTTFNNRYRTIDIPVIFAYEFVKSRNFTVGLNAGAIINLNSSYSGKILDTNLSPVSINTTNTLGVNAWRRNIGLGLYASLSIYKRINNQVDLFFEPYTRINLKPVTVNETLIKQKYTTTGLQVGLRYNLFHKRQRYIE